MVAGTPRMVRRTALVEFVALAAPIFVSSSAFVRFLSITLCSWIIAKGK